MITERTLIIIAIVEGLLLVVCIGLLLRAWWWIRIKNGALNNYIRREKEQIRQRIEREKKGKNGEWEIGYRV
jgi:hypothetical protein